MSDKLWMVYNKKGDFTELGKRLGVDPVIARILINRDLSEDEMYGYLHPDKGRLYDGSLLKDADKAADIIREAIGENKHIRIIGDYDVDGIFSTYILTEGLSRLGANVSYDIPHRITDGYGMNRRLVDAAANDGVYLVITCDNGIKAMDEIALAKTYGMKVIVTDHHELDFEINEDGTKRYLIPEADAVVNPHRDDCDYPFSDICGAYVAQKLISVLYKLYDRGDEADYFLPFAAFATVGDIMPLKDENRTLVYNGLKVLKSCDNEGMRSLISLTISEDREINTFDVGFVLGPCFNAAGRLDSAIKGLELLLEKDKSKALRRALELKELNEYRKRMTEEGAARAAELIESEGASDRVLAVYVPDLHESLAGIVAGRIKEKYYRPTFIFTDAKEGIKGSGRSIPGYSMAEKLHEVRELLNRFGGHPMAAGLSLDKDKLKSFHDRINEACGLSEDDLRNTIWIDAPMPISYVTKELILQLAGLEPFGEGNERPLFATKDVRPISARYMGAEKAHIKFILPANKNGDRMEAVYFRYAGTLVEDLEEKYSKAEVGKLFNGELSEVRLTFTYYPQLNVWQGREVLQVRIEDYM